MVEFGDLEYDWGYGDGVDEVVDCWVDEFGFGLLVGIGDD